MPCFGPKGKKKPQPTPSARSWIGLKAIPSSVSGICVIPIEIHFSGSCVIDLERHLSGSCVIPIERQMSSLWNVSLKSGLSRTVTLAMLPGSGGVSECTQEYFENNSNNKARVKVEYSSTSTIIQQVQE